MRQPFEPTRFYDTATVATRLSTTVPHMEAMRRRGEGPEFVKVGRKVRYLGECVNEWTENGGDRAN